MWGVLWSCVLPDRPWACRKKVIDAAAQRAQATAEWLESHEFMPQAELSNWVDVVSHSAAQQPPTHALEDHPGSLVVRMLHEADECTAQLSR